jgi:hypothetical protein
MSKVLLDIEELRTLADHVVGVVKIAMDTAQEASKLAAIVRESDSVGIVKAKSVKKQVCIYINSPKAVRQRISF